MRRLVARLAACCEAGGLLRGWRLVARLAALYMRQRWPRGLVLVREAGKLPPPTVSVMKPSSHISSLVSNNSKEKRIEMERDVVPRGASMVVVDDGFHGRDALCGATAIR
jgi:adenine/guanine phosphoribosyltransferase-like PRPP-binding protein